MPAFTRAIIAAVQNDLFLPILLLVVYLIFAVAIRGTLPTVDEIIATFGTLYARYGYLIVFVAAALESLALINLFAPGMVTIALGAVFARSGQIELPGLILAASCGAILGYTLDYILGAFGFSDVLTKLGYGGLLRKAHQSLVKFQKRGLALGFAYPNVGAFLSVIAGATNLSFIHFWLIAVTATVFWFTLWGLLIYSTGEIVLILLRRYSFLVVIAVVAGLILTRLWGKEEKK